MTQLNNELECGCVEIQETKGRFLVFQTDKTDCTEGHDDPRNWRSAMGNEVNSIAEQLKVAGVITDCPVENAKRFGIFNMKTCDRRELKICELHECTRQECNC